MEFFNANSALLLLIALTLFRSAISANCPQCAWDEFCFKFQGRCLKCNGIPSCSPGKTFSREDCLKTCPDFLQASTELANEPKTTDRMRDIDRKTTATTDCLHTLDKTKPKATTILNKIISQHVKPFSTDRTEKPKRITDPGFKTIDNGITHYHNKIDVEADKKDNNVKKKNVFISVITVLSIIAVGLTIPTIYLAWKTCREESDSYFPARNRGLLSQDIEETSFSQPSESQDAVPLTTTPHEMMLDMTQLFNQKINPQEGFIFDKLDEHFDEKEVDKLARDGGVNQTFIRDTYIENSHNRSNARHEVWLKWAQIKKRTFLDIYNFLPNRKDALLKVAREYFLKTEESLDM